MKKHISIFISFALFSYITVPLYSKESKPRETANAVQAVQNVKNVDNRNIESNEKNGQVFLSGKLSSKKIAGEKTAIEFLKENKLLFGIDSTTDDLKTVEVKKDEIGHTYVKFVQVIKGVKVNGSLINVHFDKNGVIVSVNGKLEKNKEVTTIGNDVISENHAIELAKKQYIFKSLRNVPKTERLIITKDNKNYEVFKINISYTEPTIGNYDVFVEVNSGKIIQTENNIRYSGSVTGSGADVLGNNRNLNLYLYGTSYQMKDLTKSATSRIVTNSFNYGTSFSSIVTNATSIFNTEDYKASVSAHYNAGKVIDFYKNLFNRNSLDDNGMSINSYTHYGKNFNNAFWDGYEMVYGDGDGRNFTYLSGDLDLVGHEMTHGVISNTANLQYHNQSGALNESIADVFGVLISTYDKYKVASGGTWTFKASDWVIGDDIYTPFILGDALRSLSNPTLYEQPDNMSKYEYYPDTEAGDYGGVHRNSGIPNKAAYLVAKSLGMEKTARIYYRALEKYMSATTDFQQGRNSLHQAAADLYGGNSAEVSAINSAFYSVGVGSQVVEEINEPMQITRSIEAKSSSYNSINIMWSEVASANGYEVYSGTTSGGASRFLTDSTATSYNNTELTTDSTYYYKVRAYRMTPSGKVYGDFSTETSAKPMPATPVDFNVITISPVRIKVIWSTVTGAHGYEVYSLLTRRKYIYYTNSALITSKPSNYKMRAFRIVGTVKIYSNWTEVVNAKP
jgi:bacillolysin